MRRLVTALLLVAAGTTPLLAQGGDGVTPTRPERFALWVPDSSRYETVPRFPEDMAVQGVLGAAMDMLDDDLGLLWDEPARMGLQVDRPHAFFMGVTGEAFSFGWFPKDSRLPAPDSLTCGPDPGAPFRRALAAAGYACEVLERPGLAAGRPEPFDGSELKARVLECLVDRRLPVIAAPLPGPNQCMLVTGYDDGGDTLTGWVAEGGGADIRFEIARRVNVSDWQEAPDLVVLLNGRRERPSERAAVRDALVQAVSILRRREYGPHHAGAASFEVWAAAIVSEDPPDLGAPADVPRSIPSRRSFLICPISWDLMERASYAAMFLRRATRLFPSAAAELEAATGCIEAVDQAMVQVCSLTGLGPGDMLAEEGRFRRLSDPEVLREVAGILTDAGVKWLEAADHLEQALAHAE